MIQIPDMIGADDFARQLGWSVRRLKTFARGLGACRIMGNRMVFTQSDVAIIMLACKPNMTVEDVREWLGEDAAELHAEAEYQNFAAPVGVVYFVRRGNEVKIGFTKDIDKRMTNLKTGTTEPMEVLLTIPATLKLEGYFHDKFAEFRIEREWFKATDDLLNFIARRGFGK